MSFRWSHVFLSLSCREISPVLPTHDREDPLANVNARITVFIAQANVFLSFPIASPPPINTYAQYVVRRSLGPGNRPWPSAAPETIPGRAFRRPPLHHHQHHHHHRKVNHRRCSYRHARRSTSLSFPLSLSFSLFHFSAISSSLISGFLDRLTEARIKLRSKDTAGHLVTMIFATRTLVRSAAVAASAWLLRMG